MGSTINLSGALIPTAPTPVFISPYRAIIGKPDLGTPGSGGTHQGVVAPNALSLELGSPNVLSAVAGTVYTTIVADAVVEEESDDELILTEQPVEQGAVISDHAYKMPSKLSLLYGWVTGSAQNRPPVGQNDPNFLADIYQQLLNLQATRTPCQVFTGKRIYENMMITRIRQKTDKENENILLVSIEMQEVLMAVTNPATIADASQHKYPQQTAPTLNKGNQTLQNAPNFNFTAAP